MLATTIPLNDILKVNRLTTESFHQESVKIEVDLSILKRLFENRQICAADLRCLDNQSKQHVKDLCLKTCLICKQS